MVAGYGKNVEVFTHKVGLEEAALYLVLDLFADADKIPAAIKDDMPSREDLVNMLGGDAEKFDAAFTKMMKKKENFSMMIGEDLYYHKNAENIAKLIAVVEATSSIEVVMTPPKSNALGVALICDLDDDTSGYTVGYNENGDFKLSALGNGDLDMPAMNQQEGTLTNIGKRVLPTNAALEYHGYELNDLVKVLISAPELTIDWTAMLPIDRGFKAVEFDSLPNSFTNKGVDNRGYRLENKNVETELPETSKINKEELLDGDIAYRCNPTRQFNDFTDKSHEIFETFSLYASSSKAESLGDKVEVVFENGSLTLDVVVDEKITGDIVKVPDFKSEHDVYSLFGESRYAKVTLRKV